MTGINAITIYSASIMQRIDPELLQSGCYLIAAANVLGAILAPNIKPYFTIKAMLMLG